MAVRRAAAAGPVDPTVWLLFAVTSLLVLVAQLPYTHATAWHFFEDAADLLFARDGLHLYEAHPEFQFGPLSIAVAAPFTSLGDDAAMVALSLAGLVGLGFLVGAVRAERPDVDWSVARWPVAVGGVTFLVVWGDVAVRTAHLDDGLALAATCVGLWCAAHDRPWGTALALGVASAAKPWACAFAPIALVPTGRRRWPRLALTAGVVLASWAPFLIAEPSTLDASSFDIRNEPSSALRILGVGTATTPSWVRPTQLLVGFAVALWLVRRDRWVAAVMAAVAIRLMIDPAANRYYTIGLVVGVLFFELVRAPNRLPWAAVATAGLLEVTQASGMPGTLGGVIRLVVTVAALAAAFALPLPEPGSGKPPAVRSPNVRSPNVRSQA